MGATTTEETTVEMRTEHGSTGPMPMSEFEERADEARNRLRNSQLSFDVGGREPNASSIKASIYLAIGRQLRKGEQVRVAVTTAEGEVLAQTVGKVVSIAFEDQFEKGFLVGCERVHRVTTGS